MTTIFLTGDRSMEPMAALIAATLLLGEARDVLDALGEESGPASVATGDNPTGVEAGLRYLLPGVRVFVAGEGEDGKPDLDVKHLSASMLCEKALIFHADPMASSVVRSAVKFWSDDDLMFLP